MIEDKNCIENLSNFESKKFSFFLKTLNMSNSNIKKLIILKKLCLTKDIIQDFDKLLKNVKKLATSNLTKSKYYFEK